LTRRVDLWQNPASQRLFPEIVPMSAHRILESIEKSQRRQASLPEFRPGDSIKVWAKIREGEKTRLQAFEGVCIRRVSKGSRSTFTVRKISYGVGVERIFPDNSPNIDKIEVISRGRVHQARLYYLRDLSGKAARIKEREGTTEERAADAAARAEAAAAEAPPPQAEAKVKVKKERKKEKKKS
jgi:large subunit ribosomal protein L19